MSDGVRPATADDLEAIVALTAAKRRRLAAWSPTWWQVSEGADELHRLWLGHLVSADGPNVRVIVDGGAVVGCAIAMPQGDQWFVDDVALAEDEPEQPWGVELLRSVTERPALTCVPTLDLDGRVTAESAGLAAASTYWVRPTEAGDPTTDASDPVEGAPESESAPPHTFGGPFDPGAEGSLAIAVAGGIVIGSRSLPPPPVYGTGATTAIVDRVVGPDREALLRAASAAAHARGDALVCAVCATGDDELEAALTAADYERTVEVYAWP